MFEVILELNDRIQALDEHQILRQIFDDEELQRKIIEMNKMQLAEGKGADFNDLPRYEDDSFFKSVKSAKAYEAWKATISQNPNKPRGVMDFYIDGTFYSTIKFLNSGNGFFLISDSPIADDIQLKTGTEALGIADENLNILFPEIEAKYIEILEEKIFP